ncbi:MAG: phosphatidylserine decarboxylase [Bacteroidales bacterium]|nr:phosphatidylserine decarboxylase [Bacteroidales bacterium]
MKIDKDSYGDLALVFVLAAFAIWACLRFVQPRWLAWTLTAVVWVFAMWQLFFFRVPERRRAGNGKLISSAADGRVVIVDESYEDEVLGRDCKRVCVYMDFFDVHVNFWPVSGTVKYYRYHVGKHLLAFRPKASEDNEHTTAVILTPDGQEVLFRQLAGTFARRIVCYAEPGSEVQAGEQCGIIKFGSRLDIYLPLDAEIRVKVGDHVKAAEDIIASLR